MNAFLCTYLWRFWLLLCNAFCFQLKWGATHSARSMGQPRLGGWFLKLQLMTSEQKLRAVGLPQQQKRSKLLAVEMLSCFGAFVWRCVTDGYCHCGQCLPGARGAGSCLSTWWRPFSDVFHRPCPSFPHLWASEVAGRMENQRAFVSCGHCHRRWGIWRLLAAGCSESNLQSIAERLAISQWHHVVQNRVHCWTDKVQNTWNSSISLSTNQYFKRNFSFMFGQIQMFNFPQQPDPLSSSRFYCHASGVSLHTKYLSPFSKH